MGFRDWQTLKLAIILPQENNIATAFKQYIFPELCAWCEKWQLSLQDAVFFNTTDSKDFLNLTKSKKEFVAIWLGIKETENAFKFTSNNTAIFFRDVVKEKLDTTELIKLIGDDFKNIISESFYDKIEDAWKNNIANYWDMVKERQQAFVYNCTRLTTARVQKLDKLQQYIEGNSQQVFVVHGKEGSGKSTLLAHFYQKISLKYPCVIHFVGIGPNCELRDRTLERLIYEIKKIHNMGKIKGAHLYQKWETILTYIAKKTVIIIDGLEHLQPQHSYTLSWLPARLPANVKIIVSIGETVSKQHLLNKTDTSLELLLNKEEKNNIARLIGIDQENIEKYTTPMSLHTLHQESWLQKEHPAFIALQNNDLPQFLLLLLQQIENEWEQKQPLLAGSLFSLLACVRHGIKPQELSELLLAVDEEYSHLKILYRLQRYFARRRDIFIISNTCFAEAIKKFCDNKKTWHQHLAFYFGEQPLHLVSSSQDTYYNIRKLQELPWHLMQGEMINEAIKLLCDIEFLEAKVKTNLTFELLEDFRLLLKKLPKDTKLEIAPGVHIDKKAIKLLELFFSKLVDGVWGINHSNIRNHPHWLFQTLWNVGFWHDSPQAKKHLLMFGIDKINKKNTKLYPLVEHWRKIVETKKRIWFRSSLPYLIELEFPLAQILTFAKAKKAIFSFDNSKMAIDLGKNGVAVWDVKTKEFIYFFSKDVTVANIFFSHDAQILIISTYDTNYFYCLQKGALLHEIEETSISKLCPDGQKMVTANGRQLRYIKTQKIIYASTLKSICFSNDGKLLAYKKRKKIYVVNTDTGEKIKEIYTPFSLLYLMFSANGKKLLEIAKGKVRIWDLAAKNYYITLEKSDNTLEYITFSFDNSLVAIVLESEEIGVWNAITGKLIKKLSLSTEGLIEIKFSEDNKKIMMFFDHYWYVWEIAKAKPLHCYIQRGCFLAVSHSAPYIIVYNGKPGRIPLANNLLIPEKRKPSNIRFSCDAKKIFVDIGNIKVWDTNGEFFTSLPRGQLSRDMNFALEYVFEKGYKLLETKTAKTLTFFKTKDKVFFDENTVLEKTTGKILYQWQENILEVDNALYDMEKKGQQMLLKRKGEEEALAYFPMLLEKVKISNNCIFGYTKIAPGLYASDIFQMFILHIENV